MGCESGGVLTREPGEWRDRRRVGRKKDPKMWEGCCKMESPRLVAPSQHFQTHSVGQQQYLQ